MFKRQLLAMIVVVMVAFAGVLSAQTAATPPASGPAGPDPNQPKAESVLKYIPADCLGFVVAGNVKDLLGGVEKFAGSIGMAEMLQGAAPQGLLSTIAMMVGLGEGYNPNGGVALIVTDLEKSGIDVATLFDAKQPPNIKPPIVILLAGKDAKGIFPAATPAKDGKGLIIPPMGKMYTAKLGDYVAISPSAQALALMGKMPLVIPPKHAALIAKNDVSVYYNLKVAAATIKAVIEAQEAAEKKANAPAAGTDTPPAARPATKTGMMMQMAKMYSGFLDQMDALTYGLRFAEAGMLVEMLVDCKPDSDMGKILASYAAITETPKMDRLPNLPYVLAGGMAIGGVDVKTYMEQNMKMVESILGILDLELPADLKGRMIALGTDLGGEITAVQFVAGAAKQKGVFGFAEVIACKDAAKLRALIAQEPAILTELVQKTVAKTVKELASLEFKYIEGAETVNGVKVDAIEILHEELAELSEEDKAEMVKILADDRMRFLIAEVDPKTLVVTFGGSTEFLAEVMRVAKAGGNIQADPDVVKTLALLPKNSKFVMVFSAKNLFETVQAGMKKMDEKSNLPADFAFEGKTPIAMGSAVEGNSARCVLYVPSSAVKDVIAWVTAEIAAAMTPPTTAEAKSEPPATAPAGKK